MSVKNLKTVIEQSRTNNCTNGIKFKLANL